MIHDINRSEIPRHPGRSIRVLLVVALFVVVSVLQGCGGGGGSGSADSTGDDSVVLTPQPEIGVLLDNVVSGVIFRTASQQGVTNSRGEFRYLEGEMITFLVGDIVIGSARGAAILTPV